MRCLRAPDSLLSVIALWRPGCRVANCRKATAMKLTLDSSEPLEDAMRVVGALYGVTLVLSSDGQAPSKPASRNATKPTNSRRTGTASKRSSAPRAVRAVAPATDAKATQSKQRTAQRSTGAPGNAELRSWARQNGFTVKDRGRVPASVVTAYRNAQSD